MSDAGKELDLYEGLDPKAGAASDRRTAPASARGATASEGWIEALAASFPREVRERYQVLGVLGEGGMGIVLEARDLRMDRVVAIKGLKDPRGVADSGRERLSNEVRLAARLAHPNILPVYDVWVDLHQNPWCSMLRVAGEAPTLTRRLAELADRKRLSDRPVAELLEIFLQLCRAIAFAHRTGVLHRDIKPDNVLLGPSGEALVADWGVACGMGEAEPGVIVGTPGYAAPEQLGALGAPRTDVRSDVYGLGMILFEMLAARPAAATATVAQQYVPRSRAAAVVPDRVPRELAAILRRGIATDPAERYPDVPSLQRAIEAYLTGGVIEGIPYSLAERLAKWARAHQALAVASVILAIVVPLFALQIVNHSAERDRQLSDTRRKLAAAHDVSVQVRQGEGDLEAARLHAALALEALGEAPPGSMLPRAHAWTTFAGTGPRGPLRWAALLDAPAEVVEFTPDSRGLRVGSRAPAVWQLGLSGGPFQQVKLPAGEVWGLALAREAPRVATAHPDGKVAVWDTSSGAKVMELAGHKGQFWSLAFHRDGSLLATGGFDRTVRIWEPVRGACRAVLTGHSAQVWSVAISADARWVASGDQDGGIIVWDILAGRLAQRIEGYKADVLALAFSPDGRWLAAGGGDGLWIFELKSGRPIVTRAYGLRSPTVLAFTPDSRRLAAGSHEGPITLHEVESDRPAVKLVGHAHWVSGLSFSADGRLLASVGQDKNVRVWDTTPEPARPVAKAPASLGVVFTSSGELVSSAADRTASFWSVPERAPGRTLTLARPAKVLARDERGRLLALSPGERSVAMMDLATPEQEVTLAEGAAEVPVAFAPGGTHAAITTHDMRVRVVELASRRTVYEAPRTAPLHAVALSPGGRLLATAGTARDVHVHDTRNAALPPRVLKGHTLTVDGLAFSPDGRKLASGSQDLTARVWDLESGASVTLGPVGNHVFTVAFSPDGELLAGGSLDSTLWLWRLPDGAPIARLEVNGTMATAIAFSPDGRWMATAGGAGPQLWNLEAIRSPASRIAQVKAESYLETAPEDVVPQPKPPGRAPPARY